MTALLFAAAAHADVEIMLKTSTMDKPASTSHLTLAPAWFHVDSADEALTFDFTAAKHRLTDDSLFGIVDGRARELQNRKFLGAALEAAKADNNPLALTLAEHQVSMRSETHEQDGARRFVWNGRELMVWSSELVPVTGNRDEGRPSPCRRPGEGRQPHLSL